MALLVHVHANAVVAAHEEGGYAVVDGPEGGWQRVCTSVGGDIVAG